MSLLRNEIRLLVTVNFSKIIATLTLIFGFTLSLVNGETLSFAAAVGVVMVIVGARDISENFVKRTKCKDGSN